MNRTRESTKVDGDKLASAPTTTPNVPEAALLDEAPAARIARHRAAELDATYVGRDVELRSSIVLL
jgi:hypothetical protein